MRLLPASSLLVACTLDDHAPIIEGYHCAEDREDQYVACVVDGDTFQVNSCGGESVRMLGINAPEIAHTEDETDQCYGPEAQAWLTSMLTGQFVRLAFDTECADAYDRTLAYVYLTVDEDELLLNERSVREGMSRVYEDFDDIRLADLLYTAEYAAQQNDAGLWSVCE